MDSVRGVMNWVTALRIQGPNKSTTKSMKRGPVKGRSHDAQLQILLQLLQELASFSLLFMICSLSCWAISWLFLIGLHKSSILHLRRGRVLPFQLSVSPPPSYSVKPPQPGSLVGPVMKNSARIPIRDRGHGWQWKSIDILIAKSLSFHSVLTSQLPECGWSKAEESSSFYLALTSQLLERLEQGSASFVGEGCCLWNQTLRRFWGP